MIARQPRLMSPAIQRRMFTESQSFTSLIKPSTSDTHLMPPPPIRLKQNYESISQPRLNRRDVILLKLF